MQLFYPKYYHQFRCLAAACPDSCCASWVVDVDEETAARYRALPGPLGDRLRQALCRNALDEPYYMGIVDGRCPMWQQDGLCAIQVELGHDALCEVCRSFPRLRHEYGEFTELGLDLACPAAARLILQSPDQELLSEQCPGAGEPCVDPEAMAILRPTRETALAIISDETRTVPEALATLLLFAHSVQHMFYGGPEAKVPEHIPHVDKPGDLGKLLRFFTGMHILTPQWRSRLQQPSPGQWAPELRRLARYFIMRYWLWGISDLDIVSRAKLTVTACIMVRCLGGDTVATAQLLSKEIESDPDNIDLLLDGAYTNPAMTDENLLALLQN